MPRFIVIVLADAEAESGAMSTTEQFADMTTFNEELVKAGVMVSGEGLLPSSRDWYRLSFSSTADPTVVKGPLENPALSGWWVIKTKDVDEALEWCKKIPFKSGGVELRRIAEADDFGAEFTDELKAREGAMRAKLGEGEA
ncbi:dgpfaetke family protein [Histoplasma ohiense]|nr:dgpfaetke family protein [Histoplasma ohiense (nom. inval.)]